eukprot:CAMPEP_0194026604 /NCGR_PEP_ID=MMETSP0009_2-20130614/914_1 /TAXON_ID=210454 /ORGANISM="Grammatophora oceanica, Strain CCMP 410" /LENGTH=124 /DNA_ID=CAMNT_0038665397 /DNA_START=278 /DNA_END=648 /DNA_ORIENTATION=-
MYLAFFNPRPKGTGQSIWRLLTAAWDPIHILHSSTLNTPPHLTTIMSRTRGRRGSSPPLMEQVELSLTKSIEVEGYTGQTCLTLMLPSNLRCHKCDPVFEKSILHTTKLRPFFLEISSETVSFL